jgi:hypothetical protein
MYTIGRTTTIIVAEMAIFNKNIGFFTNKGKILIKT